MPLNIIILTNIVVITLMLSAVTVAHDQSNIKSATTLDDTLLDELSGDGLLDGLDDIPVDPAFKEKGDNTPIDPKDQKLLDELGEGEDIELGGEDELTRIARQMREVQRRMEGKEVSKQTQELQEKIVADLDALIKQLQQQKKQSSSSSSSPSQPRNQDVQQPDAQPDAGQDKPSNKPAQDSDAAPRTSKSRGDRRGGDGGTGQASLGPFARSGAARVGQRQHRRVSPEVSAGHRGILSPPGGTDEVGRESSRVSGFKKSLLHSVNSGLTRKSAVSSANSFHIPQTREDSRPTLRNKFAIRRRIEYAKSLTRRKGSGDRLWPSVAVNSSPRPASQGYP